MSKYDWAAIKARVSIADVIGRSVKLNKKNQGLCPFHAEKTPSFHVYDDNYHCFGCGAHGDVVDFVAQMSGCSTAEAIGKLGAGDFELTGREKKILAEREKQREAERREATREAQRRWDNAPQATAANAYLMRKQIGPHMARLDGKALLLPVYDRDGNIQSVQTITGAGDKLFHPKAPMKGGRLNFGICIGRTIVCEGFATGASIYEAVPDRVAVGFSKSGVIDLVRELHENGQEVAIASDRNALPEMIALSQELGVPVYAPSAPHDDFNDMAVALLDAGEDPAPEIRAILDGPPIASGKDASAGKPDRDRPSAANDDAADPVDIWERNAPPSLPQGLLPPVIERAAIQASMLSGADPGGYAMGMLCAAGAAITDRIRVKVKVSEEWHEEARIWVMLLGEPSYKKSPIMKTCTRALARLDAQLVGEYEREFNDWSEHKNGEPPTPRRMRIDDITMEAAQKVARHNPDGVLAMQDELSGWFGGIEKYAGGKGSAKDRSFWLRAFGGGSYAVNRISRKPFLIENLSISVLGGIQPDAIRRVMADATDDGLIQRFFPVVLRPAVLERDDVPDDAVREYDALIERLSGIVPPSNYFGDVALRFDDDAQQIRNDLHVKHHEMVQAMESVNKKMASHLGKYDGIFPRLCVIWHVIESANLDELPEVISGATARRVARFLHDYIMRHAMAFYFTMIGFSEDQEIIQDVAGYILAHKVKTVTMRTFQRGSTRMRKLTRQQVEPLCHQLEALGWLDEIDARGARLTAKVNPRVHEIYGSKAEEEKSRREDIRRAIYDMARGHGDEAKRKGA